MHSAAIFQDVMYTFGGVLVGSSDKLTNELWAFDLNSKIWTNLTAVEDHRNWPRARAGWDVIIRHLISLLDI